MGDGLTGSRLSAFSVFGLPLLKFALKASGGYRGGQPVLGLTMRGPLGFLRPGDAIDLFPIGSPAHGVTSPTAISYLLRRAVVAGGDADGHVRIADEQRHEAGAGAPGG